MEFKLANRMEHLKTSEIREILKVTERPEVISFAGGLPAPEAFPVEVMSEAAARVIARDGRRVLQYSTTEGLPELRRTIADRMANRFGASFSPDEILVTAGSQQGLDLLAKVFIDQDDALLCESPTYLGALQAFRTYGPRFVGVETDDDGMVISALEETLDREPRAKLIYTIPDFQNPSGRSWSVERRRALLDVAVRRGIPVIEDAPYAELRFAGPPRPSLAALDRMGHVVFLGSFSKIFCPGLRLGWMAIRQPLYQKLVLAKQGTDLHTSTLGQALAAEVFNTINVDSHVERIRNLYRGRRDAMVKALERELPPSTTFTRPEGGLFIWMELPDGINARALLERCLAVDLAFVPGSGFFADTGHDNTARLNYSNMPEARIEEGVARLGKILRDMLG